MGLGENSDERGGKSRKTRVSTMSERAVRKSAQPAKAITSPIRADRAYLLGSLYEKIEPNGDRHFSGTLAGMMYLLTPAGPAKSATGERKWNLHVLPAGSSDVNSARRIRRALSQLTNRDA